MTSPGLIFLYTDKHWLCVPNQKERNSRVADRELPIVDPFAGVLCKLFWYAWKIREFGAEHPIVDCSGYFLGTDSSKAVILDAVAVERFRH
jgi:hypothetical protein